MAHWRLDGQPRTARRYATYMNCPLPTPEDRLLFILVYLKTYPLRWYRGGYSGWSQARPINGFMSSWWCCRQPCARWGGSSRSLTELAQRIGVAEANAAAVVGSPTTPICP